MSVDSRAIHFRLENPAEHDRREAADREWEQRKARRTDSTLFLEAIPLVVQAEFGVWSKDDLAPLFAAVGWPIEEEPVSFRKGRTAGIESETISISLRASKTEQYLDPDRWGFGEYSRVWMTQRLAANVVDDAYRAALAICVELLGPPPLVGGPDARAIWRDNDTTVLLTRDLGSSISLAVFPTEPHEGREHWEWNWSDWTAAECWLVAPDAEGTRYGFPTWGYPEPLATSWPSLDDYIDALFLSLAADLPVLHPYATWVIWVITVADDPDAGFLQGWFSPHDARMEYRHSADADLTTVNYPAGVAAGRSIAEVVKSELRALGVPSPDRLTLSAWSSPEPQQIHTIRLGLEGSG
ncbi:hypothetical protein [Nocardia sp. NPDC050710]|uniref:hypothetical protein n=1 Tax=Nocardia sp. NPDC050710 TaxID=3157220 RepID=UPI0033F5AFDA